MYDVFFGRLKNSSTNISFVSKLRGLLRARLEWLGALLAEIARHVTRTRRIREFLRFQSNTKSVEIRRGARHARVQQRTQATRCEREAYAARMLRRDCRQIFIIGLDKSLVRVMQSRSRVFTFSFRVDLDEEPTWQRNALCRKRTRRSSTLWKSLAATVLCITSARSRAVPRRNAGSRKTRHRNAAATVALFLAWHVSARR